MRVIDRAKTHFSEQLNGDAVVVEAPEWLDDDGSPTLIYVLPMTMEERSKIYKHSSVNSLEALVETLLQRARGADGKLLFSFADRVHLMRKVDPVVIERVVIEMNTKQPDVTMEEAEGN